MKKVWPALIAILAVLIGVVLVIHIRPTSATGPKSAIPAFKSPWDQADNPWVYRSGPHGRGDATICAEYPVEDLDGIDFAKEGDSAGRHVLAMASGRVTWAGWREGGWGNMVEIDHGEYQTRYAHLMYDPKTRPGIRVEQTVPQGAVVGFARYLIY